MTDMTSTKDRIFEILRATGRPGIEAVIDHLETPDTSSAIAVGVYLARTGHDKVDLRRYVEETLGYDLSPTVDEIRHCGRARRCHPGDGDSEILVGVRI